ncbi:MAG: sulfatase [Planctomycetes bacterium]|nr:sulfatase [Planctomycetota bacterium]
MNVLLITADTLRADHMSCYGYWRKTSPNLDRLAAEGVLFERFIGQCAHTLPSFTSLMTGKTPFETGAVATLHCVPDTPSGRLSDKTPVLAELLARGGVHTVAVDNLINFACHPSWLVRGFGEYLNPNPESFVAEVTADGVNAVLLPLLERAKEPFFIWAHYWDPHLPYNQPDEFLSPFDPADAENHICETPDGMKHVPRWGALEALDSFSWAGGAAKHQSGERVKGTRNMIGAYDGEILFLDRRLGDVFEKLQSLGLYDETNILFTADHGETMADHVTHFCHVEALDACTHLPFIMKPAKSLGIDPRATDAFATHTDLAPTALDLLGVETDAPMEGHSLRPVLEGSGEWPRDHVVSTGMYLLDDGIWKSIEVAARTAQWRLRLRSQLRDYPKEDTRVCGKSSPEYMRTSRRRSSSRAAATRTSWPMSRRRTRRSSKS